MSSGARKAVLILAVLVILGAGGYVASQLLRSEGKAIIERAWKCTKCGHVFEREFEPDPWAVPNAAPDGSVRLEQEACPKCGGVAHRHIALVCGKCGEVFQHTEELDSARREPKRPVCPKCKSDVVSPHAPAR